MATAYASQSDVQFLGSMPQEDVIALETTYPGIVAATVAAVSAGFDAKLMKRYAAPFAVPYPQTLVFNVARETAWRLWLKRGFNPSGKEDQALEKDHLEAMAWLDEAANSQTGLIELPARDQPLGAGAVGAGGPMAYSETSPYAWTALQRNIGRQEDSNG